MKRNHFIMCLFFIFSICIYGGEFKFGVIVDKAPLIKSEYYKDTKLGVISDIKRFIIKGNENVIIAAGTEGAVVLQDGNNKVSNIFYQKSLGANVDIIDFENDGKAEFINRGEWAIPVFSIGFDGKIATRFPEAGAFNDAEAGDINGDGVLEVVAGYNGRSGLILYDKNGTKIWKQKSGNTWAVAIADVNDDGKKEILNRDNSNFLLTRDSKGKIINRAKIPNYFGDFWATNWHDGPEKSKILFVLFGDDTGENSCFGVADYKMNIIAKLDVKEFVGATSAKGLAFKHKGINYYGLVLSHYHDASIFYLFDKDNEKIYEERFKEQGRGIMYDKGALLIGLNGKVLKYTFK